MLFKMSYVVVFDAAAALVEQPATASARTLASRPHAAKQGNVGRGASLRELSQRDLHRTVREQRDRDPALHLPLRPTQSTPVPVTQSSPRPTATDECDTYGNDCTPANRATSGGKTAPPRRRPPALRSAPEKRSPRPEPTNRRSVPGSGASP
jgi:hypothetical protein